MEPAPVLLSKPSQCPGAADVGLALQRWASIEE